MRLTGTKDASKQAFENAQLRIIGGCLPPTEVARIAASDAPEIALKQ